MLTALCAMLAGVGNAIGLLCIMRHGTVQYCTDMMQYTDESLPNSGSLIDAAEQLQPYCSCGEILDVAVQQSLICECLT